MIRVIALNELRRRLRDRSVLIGCLAAPLLMSAVLGLSFAGSGSAQAVRVGVSGASPQLTASCVHASQPPCDVTAVSMPSEQAVETAVANGSLDSGVAVLPGQMRLGGLLVPVVDPVPTHTRIQRGDKGRSQLG